jgi:protein-L-isoaspartate(D-aspartate) O-methyltransferase
MRQVHREDFVPPDMRDAAFRDGALPIGHGQTISQPYIVALMTDLLELSEQSIVLEIGTGTGYQAAILACLAKQVYSIERIPALAQAAQQRLQKMGYDNVETRCGDGYQGWPEKAPFDGIVVTAAAPYVPPALLEQLKPGGRMVIPVGIPSMHQELMLVTRDLLGETHTSSVLGVAFVPLVEEN